MLLVQRTRDHAGTGSHGLHSSAARIAASVVLCDRPIDRVRGALKLAFTPTAGDYEAMRLPPAFWSAYYATRPCRLAFRTATRRS